MATAAISIGSILQGVNGKPSLRGVHPRDRDAVANRQPGGHQDPVAAELSERHGTLPHRAALRIEEPDEGGVVGRGDDGISRNVQASRCGPAGRL